MSKRTLKITTWACFSEYPTLAEQAIHYTLMQASTPHVRVIIPVDVLGTSQKYSSHEFMAPDYSEDQNGEYFLSPSESQVAMQLDSTLTFCQALLIAVEDFSNVHFGDALWVHPKKEDLFSLTLNPDFSKKFPLATYVSEAGADGFWEIIPKIVDDLLDQFENENAVELVLVFPESLNPWSLLWFDFLILMVQRKENQDRLPKELFSINFELDMFMLDQANYAQIPAYFNLLLPYVKAPPTLDNKNETQQSSSDTSSLAQ